jgi:hypothetical protein
LTEHAPKLGERFGVDQLADLPGPLARHVAAKWLAQRGAPMAKIDRAACERLVRMAADAATPARQVFAGNLTIRRKRGEISCDPAD